MVHGSQPENGSAERNSELGANKQLRLAIENDQSPICCCKNDNSQFKAPPQFLSVFASENGDTNVRVDSGVSAITDRPHVTLLTRHHFGGARTLDLVGHEYSFLGA